MNEVASDGEHKEMHRQIEGLSKDKVVETVLVQDLQFVLLPEDNVCHQEGKSHDRLFLLDCQFKVAGTKEQVLRARVSVVNQDVEEDDEQATFLVGHLVELIIHVDWSLHHPPWTVPGWQEAVDDTVEATELVS